MSLTLEDLHQVNVELLEEHERAKINGANLLLKKAGVNAIVNSEPEALKILNDFLFQLLEADNYLHASALLFSRDKFDPRPNCVKKIFKNMHEHSRLCIPGASSLGKTYAGAVWLLLDWIREPEYTKIVLASVNATHLRTNLFAHITDMFKSASIPLKGKTKDLFIGLDLNQMDYGIKGVIFPQDDSRSGGRLKGMKAGNRNKKHKRWGKLGRLRLLIDEGQNIPANVFADFPSIEASINDIGTVKIIVSGNPESYSVSRDFGRLCEPDGGFDTLDLDTDKEWEGKTGYHVCRLDADDCENIIERKIVFEGLQTYEGYLGIQRKGLNHYLTFCRGMFPTKGSFDVAINQSTISKSIGTCVFPHGFVNVASVDLALKEDKVILTAGRWGLSSGMKDINGQPELFRNNGTPTAKHMLQIDQQFAIEEIHDDILLAKEIMRICKTMSISPEWLALDSTVGGSGVYSYLSHYFGKVLGLEWGKSASEYKVLAEDDQYAKDRFNRISDEMWFATGEWFKIGAIKLAPSIDRHPLFDQLSTRRVQKPSSSGKQRVESKPEYKARNHGVSPDYADSFVMLQQLIRQRGDVVPSMGNEDGKKFKLDDKDLPPIISGKKGLKYKKVSKKEEKMPWEK